MAQHGSRQEMLAPRAAAEALGISYPTLKQWIYRGKLKTVKTAGGHHRIPARELDKYLPRAADDKVERKRFRRTSGRNQLVGRIVDIKVSGLLAQVKLSIGGQQITSIITAEAAREMGLRKGQTAAALVKSTEVMITLA
jgi:molybdopterin-binding protein